MARPACLDYRSIEPDVHFDHGTMRRVSEAVASANQSVSLIEFAPGEGGPLSAHADPVEEFYFVVEGRFSVQLDDDVHDAGPGAVAYIPPGTRHRPENVADEPGVLLVVQTPPAENTTYFDG